MKKFITLLGLMSSLWTYGQNITRIEYFFDKDPGYNNGIGLSFTTASVVSNLNVSANITTLTGGVHVLYVRSKNANAVWSQVASQAFVKFGSAVAPNISRIEYFFDQDPGYGKGITVGFTASTVVSNVNVAADLTTLTGGVHVLFARSLDAQGNWSQIASQAFVKFGSAILGNITYVEYFFDNDPGFGNGVSVPITPAITVAGLNIVADITPLSVGGHKLYVRSRDVTGSWSIVANSNFTKVAPVLSVSSSNLAFTTVGGTNVVTVSSNVAWSVAKSDAWITVSTTAGLNTRTLAITALPNTTLLGTITGFVTVSGNGISRVINVTQYSLPQSQFITLNPISNVTLSGTNQNVTISGTASSGLAVGYGIASNPSGIASLSSNVITLSNLGTVTVTGFQAGNSSYLAASPVSRVFTVSTLVGTTTTTTSPVAQTITFGTLPSITLSGVSQIINLSATASSGLAVSYTLTTNPAGIVSLSNNQLTVSNVGTVNVTASQSGNNAYLAASSVTQSFSVVTVTSGTPSTSTGSNLATVSGLQISNLLSNTAYPIKVTISGTNIKVGATATVGGVALANVSVLGTNALVGTIPAGSTVTNPSNPSVAVQNAGTVASSSTIVTPIVTEVLKEAAEKAVIIYPNPNNGSFTVSSTLVTSFQIYSLEGALLQAGSLIEGENTFTTKLSSGFYIFKAGNVSKKLLVE
jgi:hypothetical protein